MAHAAMLRSEPSNTLPGCVPLRLNGAALLADPSGALVWPERRTLVVADLHLEKGSSFARHGALLPPYDTRASLARLADAAERHGALCVICLGDSFHDRGAGGRLSAGDAEHLARLTAGRDWLWIAGNHDPAPPPEFGGRIATEATIGPLVFRHAASPGPVAGEISGHLHPTATLRLAIGRITGKCFVADRSRLILPAFGAFTGGLDVFAPAIAGLFSEGFTAHVIARGRVTTVPDKVLRGAGLKAFRG
jgi:DNA ligase-associated metallophosphoesterase